MADILKGLRTYLAATTAVTGLTSTRIYFGNLPQDPTLPAIALNLIDQETQRSTQTAQGLARSTIQVDCHDDDHAGAYAVSEQVRLATEHYTGAWGTETCRSAIVSGIRDLSEPPISGSQLYNHIRSLDVVAWHTEST